LTVNDWRLTESGVSPWQLTAVPGSAAAGQMDLLTTVLHELGHVLGFDDQQALRPISATLMTETLPDGVRRLLVADPSSVMRQASFDPNSSRVTNDDSRLTPVGAGFSFTQLQGLFTSGTQRAETSVRESGATSPVIEWADEETPATPASASLGGVKMKSSWLSKFLSATGVKQDRAAAQDFEVTLPGKHGKR
jgi:hypothetical protein